MYLLRRYCRGVHCASSVPASCRTGLPNVLFLQTPRRERRSVGNANTADALRHTGERNGTATSRRRCSGPQTFFNLKVAAQAAATPRKAERELTARTAGSSADCDAIHAS